MAGRCAGPSRCVPAPARVPAGPLQGGEPDDLGHARLPGPPALVRTLPLRRRLLAPAGYAAGGGRKERLRVICSSCCRARSDRPSRYTQRGIPYHRGYLLTGPSGCGKTLIARVAASELKMELWVLDLSLPQLHDEAIEKLFSQARAGSQGRRERACAPDTAPPAGLTLWSHAASRQPRPCGRGACRRAPPHHRAERERRIVCGVWCAKAGPSQHHRSSQERRLHVRQGQAAPGRRCPRRRAGEAGRVEGAARLATCSTPTTMLRAARNAAWV